MSSCPEQSLFATGSYLRTVFIFDSRSGEKPIRQYRPHGGAVIKLAMNSEYILSASEDKTVSVWDQRAGRIMKYITVKSLMYFNNIEEKKYIRYRRYFVDSRRSISHVHEHATRLCLHRGQRRQAARIKSEKGLWISEFLFYWAYKRDNGSASNARKSDNEFYRWHCQNFESYRSTETYGYFMFILRRDCKSKYHTLYKKYYIKREKVKRCKRFRIKCEIKFENKVLFIIITSCNQILSLSVKY